jgi:hypothetical protein
MQTTIDEPLQNIERKIAHRERLTLVATVATVSLFIAAAGGFLAFTYSTVNQLNAEAEQARKELVANQEHLVAARAERDQVQASVENLRVEAARQTQEVTRLSTQLAEVNAARAQAQGDVIKLQQEVEREKQEAERLRTQLRESSRQLTQLEDQIRESADFVRFLHPIDLADAKQLMSVSPPLGELLVKILEFKRRDLPFSFANNPDAGFTSPGFAGYVLQTLRKLPADIPPDAALRRLPSALEPRLGDIIQYETGFALFYLQDRRRLPFVIGMTPAGIAALNLDFGAKRTGVLRTGLSNR